MRNKANQIGLLITQNTLVISQNKKGGNWLFWPIDSNSIFCNYCHFLGQYDELAAWEVQHIVRQG
jgi:hypothetical protein